MLSFTDKVDMLDLLINVLREHEEKLDELVERMEKIGDIVKRMEKMCERCPSIN